MTEGIWIALITVGLPLIGAAIAHLWMRRTKALDHQTERAQVYESEGIAATEVLERENEELQLELEAALEDRIEDRELIQSQQYSLKLLAEAYARLAGGKAVES